MPGEYLLFHTMCSMGDSDIYTIKWLCSSYLTEAHYHTVLEWKQFTNKNIIIGYLKRSSKELDLYLYYKDSNCAAIEVRTIQSYELKEQYVKIQFELKKQSNDIKLPTPKWHRFAGIDFALKPFETIIIQIHITHKKRTDNTSQEESYLLNDPNNSDGTIESCDGVAFKIHKCVLAAKSDVFKAHFIHSDESSIIQSKFKEEILIELLKFIYSGIKAVNMTSVANELLVAADFYQLNDLKSFCEDWMYKQLTEDNVIDTLLFADLHSAVNLKNLAMDFLRSHADVVFTKPAWADLKSPEMLKALYENAILFSG